MLTGLFFVAVLFAILLYTYTRETPAARGPILLASFVAILLGCLLALLFLLRWLLRPYNQLVDEAQRASAQSQILKSKDEAEFVLETFQSVVQQLQEQRTALERLSTEARERANSAERFSERIVASLPSALIAFDANGSSITINGPGRALLEISGNAVGQSYKELFASQGELTGMVEECLDKGTLYRRSELQTTQPNGKPRRLGATIAPIELSPEQGQQGVLCLLTDITEVSELREQLALKKNLENLGEMSAGLAHEFKNAVAALQGYVQLLQSLDLNDKAQSTAASLLNEVRNLSSMVTSFLNFARPQPLRLEDVLIQDLISDCATELASLFSARRVEFEVCDQTSGSLVVKADERMLRQALLNIIRNGAEAIEDEKSDRRVSVNIREDKDDRSHWATLQVEDSGSGIPQAQLEKIFIPFFTTKPHGHGVGLALAHRVISQHGGMLTVVNMPGGGARFTIQMPQDTSAIEAE